jgi:signal peptidase I
MTDADHTAAGLSRESENPSRGHSAFPSFFVGWLRDLLIAIALALVIIAFVYQPVKVEGTSMAPLLTDQQRIFINKFVYEFEPVRRGDIVVFRYPRDPRKSFIKRVVGLPGEMVEIRHGRVYVNGVPLRENYLTRVGRDSDSFPALVLSPHHYFVLGDHRRNSNDSRTWGTVHRDYIYGKAVFAYWPPDRFGRLLAPAED